MENAKAFKEEIMRKNMKNDEHTMNFFSMRLGINSIIALANSLSVGSVSGLLTPALETQSRRQCDL